MNTKHLFGLVAVVAVAGFAASAQAGWSVSIGFPLPVYAPPVAYCPPPVAYYQTPVTYCPPQVVYAPAPCYPVVYVPQRYGPNYGYRAYSGQGRYHGQAGWNQNARGYSNGGHR